MSIICPTVTVGSDDLHEYRQQMEKVENFTDRIQVDLMDGDLAPVTSPAIDKIWFPENLRVDLHLMFRNPADVLNEVLDLKPKLLIVHAESNVDIPTLHLALSQEGIDLGLALLPQTEASAILDDLPYIKHILIFSGDLGHFGGTADLGLLRKVKQLKSYKPELEFGWDGGVNDQNAKALADGGVDVLNAGGYIQNDPDPRAAYQRLVDSIQKV